MKKSLKARGEGAKLGQKVLPVKKALHNYMGEFALGKSAGTPATTHRGAFSLLTFIILFNISKSCLAGFF